MEMEKARRRIAASFYALGAVVGIVGAGGFFALMPLIAFDMALACPDLEWLLWPGLAAVWAVAALCYLALYEFFVLARQIGRNETFSARSAKALRMMSVFTGADAALMLAGLVFLCAMDLCAPMIFIGFVVAILFFVAVAVIASAISRFVLAAEKLRAENELTI